MLVLQQVISRNPLLAYSSGQKKSFKDRLKINTNSATLSQMIWKLQWQSGVGGADRIQCFEDILS